MQKRGQAAVFIILGILVVASVMGVYFAKDYVLKSTWQRSYEKSLVVPKQAESVKNFVDSCISDIADRGITLLGQQGGYIVLPEDPYNDPLDEFGNSLEMFPGFETAYWYYKAHNNVEVFQRPNLIDMERELAAYIDVNLKECADFSGFSGYDISSRSSRTSVEIKDDEVLLDIKFPINIELKDFEFDISEFYSRIEIPLGKLYNEAVKIYNKESSDLFLERNTINTLVLSEEIPVTGITRDCGTKIWIRRDVLDAIKKYVPLDIQMFRVRGTNYELVNPESDYYELDLGVRDYDMDVNFYTSANWPYDIEIIPSEGELLKAESVTKSAGALEGLVQGFFCMNYYQFLYNMKYPVLVILSKDDFTFKFATQVVVERNEARKATFEPVSVPKIDRTFCENLQNVLDVYVYDDEGNSVSDVNIKFKCINMVCDIGETRGNYLQAEFPPCINGVIIADKEGYNKGKAMVSTNEPVVVSVEMSRTRSIGVDVSMTGRISSKLADDEVAFINMMNKESEFSSSVIYPEQKSMNLVPGEYEVYTYVMKETKGITIPGEKKEVCTKVPKRGIAGLFGAKEDKCVIVDIPSTKLDNVMIGGAKFEMDVSSNDLRNGLIKFYIPYKGIPKSTEDLSLLNLEVDENFRHPKFM